MKAAEFAKLEAGDLVRFLRGQADNDGHKTSVYAEAGDIGRVLRITRGRDYAGGPQALVTANPIDNVWCEPHELEKLNLLERIAWEVHLAEQDELRKTQRRPI